MAIDENTRGIMSNLSGTTWPDKWPQYLAIIAPIIFSLGLAGCGRSNAATKLPDTEVLVARPIQQDVPFQSVPPRRWYAPFGELLEPLSCYALDVLL